MYKKISLEQFQVIKNQLIKEYEYLKNTDSTDLTQYLKIQNILLEYDLSDIPYEEWEGITIISNEEGTIDFSNTRANIDFELVECIGNINFENCNTRNSDKLTTTINNTDFDEEFIIKYYSKKVDVSDLASLTREQLEELKKIEITKYMTNDEGNKILIDTIGIDKLIELYKYSKEEYEIINKIIIIINSLSRYSHENTNLESFEKIQEQIKNADIREIKNICFNYARKQITNSDITIKKDEYPEEFKEENKDIFLIHANIPIEVKERYFKRELTIEDLLEYQDVFNNILIDYFMKKEIQIPQFIRDNYGMGNFQKLVKQYPDIFSHIAQREDYSNFIWYYFKRGKDLNRSFINAVKEYSQNSLHSMPILVVEKVVYKYNAPEWLSSMNFKFIEELTDVKQLLEYDDSVFIIDKDQRKTINELGIENIKKLEEETGFFTNDRSKKIQNFQVLCKFFQGYKPIEFESIGINFQNGDLNYEEFKEQFAKCLDFMRKNNYFTDYPAYDNIQGEFRKKYKELFIDEDAPKELKNAFYKNKITPEFLYNHSEYIKYLENMNLSNIMNSNTVLLMIENTPNEIGNPHFKRANFIDEYTRRFGNKSFLWLCVKYGKYLDNNTVIESLHNEIEDEELIGKVVIDAIYNRILRYKTDYHELINNKDFRMEHPDIFIDFSNLTSISENERKRLTEAFYNRGLTFDDIRKHKELIDELKDKNLYLAFNYKEGINSKYFNQVSTGPRDDVIYYSIELLETLGNEDFLKLCGEFGNYLDTRIYSSLSTTDLRRDYNYEKITSNLKSVIIREIKLGNHILNPEDAPDFLREEYQELFISDDAPADLKRYFYNYNGRYPMSFSMINKHREWLPFLKDKDIITSLLRNDSLKSKYIEYLKIFGEENGIKLGINRAEIVEEMIKHNQIDLMKNWYDKTGGKFIPDYVVMINFRIEEADKFLTSGHVWSKLMRIKSFAESRETRDAMLKLAYSFGAFDGDQRGFKKVEELITKLPKTIDSDKGYIINQIDEEIDLYSQRGYYYHNSASIDEFGNIKLESKKMTDEEKEESYNQLIDHINKINFKGSVIDRDSTLKLFKSLKSEKVDIDFSKPIFSQLYKKCEDGTYLLTINQQSCPKSAQIIRNFLSNYRELPILTPKKAHVLFGGFKMKYDADFREFLLENFETIIDNPECSSYISSIQRQFSDIKRANSNRCLTLDLAISYVKKNKFTSVNPGNERAAEILTIAGYSQADFNTLQEIYNYGKQRVFSSIPRIEDTVQKRSGRYTYEMLRLDDPLAMAIGTLTDCCQELHNCAELCMEHSMVDKNGRIFVVRDEIGNIVAQSWVWRNKNVLCFDNIEIPNRTLKRVEREHPELNSSDFTDDIYEVYKQAAQELMKKDEEMYKKLFEEGKITKEQYEGLRLRKITVGKGFNDIATSLKANAKRDEEKIATPLPFEGPVKLFRGLYTDANTQYILEKREDRKEYEGETLPVYSDTYIEHTDDNFTEKNLLTLNKLEIVTKQNPNELKTNIMYYTGSKHLVREISSNYNLNPETTKIIVHPNFAIIYDINGDKLTIGDLLYNTKIDNVLQQMDMEKQVIMQMRLALDQIASNKEVDITQLNEKQKEMYNKIIGLADELDIERGVSHAR